MHLQSITYAAFRNGEEVALTLNWQTGLWLNHDSRGDKSLIWHHPFGLLKKTSDDAKTKTLLIDFGEALGQEVGVVRKVAEVYQCLTLFLSLSPSHTRTLLFLFLYQQRLQIENPGMVVFVLTSFITCHVRAREQLQGIPN
jgi:hypothetical protein